MPMKIAINGFGRIGRPALRRILDNHPDLEVVAINDLTDNKTLEHLFKYDSIYGRYDKKIKAEMLAEKDPENLPWNELKVDIVLECTGVFRDKQGAEKHLKAGAKKVIISAPAKTKEIPTFLLGINEQKYNPQKDHIVDMASCTTNCLAPMVKILNDNFGIKKGFMTTVHSYTNDQRILDLPHKDLRRARAAALNLIPTSTGAASAIGKAIPDLDGKLDGIAIRVPTSVVSILDLIVQIKKPTTKQEVNKAFLKAEKELKGIFRTEKEPLVSTDYIGDTYSSILDLEETMVKDDLVKVLGWYDNEYGYACRLAEFAEYIGKKL
ncbi:glyceraldehyde-3-phosphate dehydrogenase [Parcubacteria bacterium DG_72]|nr:MAG: glyceraldehyde-3-phosphate dehydrogenase [Parcubacteria bacterium DG_72]